MPMDGTNWPYYYPGYPYYFPGNYYYQRRQYPQQPYYNNVNGLPRAAKSALYKTELCKNFTNTGECKYGDMCQFAHGKDQIRHVYILNIFNSNHKKAQNEPQTEANYTHDEKHTDTENLRNNRNKYLFSFKNKYS